MTKKTKKISTEKIYKIYFTKMISEIYTDDEELEINREDYFILRNAVLQYTDNILYPDDLKKFSFMGKTINICN